MEGKTFSNQGVEIDDGKDCPIDVLHVQTITWGHQDEAQITVHVGQESTRQCIGACAYSTKEQWVVNLPIMDKMFWPCSIGLRNIKFTFSGRNKEDGSVYVIPSISYKLGQVERHIQLNMTKFTLVEAVNRTMIWQIPEEVVTKVQTFPKSALNQGIYFDDFEVDGSEETETESSSEEMSTSDEDPAKDFVKMDGMYDLPAPEATFEEFKEAIKEGEVPGVTSNKPPKKEGFSVFVKVVYKDTTVQFALDGLRGQDRVWRLKGLVAQNENIDCASFRVIFAGKQLDADQNKTLDECGIYKGVTIHAIVLNKDVPKRILGKPISSARPDEKMEMWVGDVKLHEQDEEESGKTYKLFEPKSRMTDIAAPFVDMDNMQVKVHRAKGDEKWYSPGDIHVDLEGEPEPLPTRAEFENRLGGARVGTIGDDVKIKWDGTALIKKGSVVHKILKDTEDLMYSKGVPKEPLMDQMVACNHHVEVTPDRPTYRLMPHPESILLKKSDKGGSMITPIGFLVREGVREGVEGFSISMSSIKEDSDGEIDLENIHDGTIRFTDGSYLGFPISGYEPFIVGKFLVIKKKKQEDAMTMSQIENDMEREHKGNLSKAVITKVEYLGCDSVNIVEKKPPVLIESVERCKALIEEAKEASNVTITTLTDEKARWEDRSHGKWLDEHEDWIDRMEREKREEEEERQRQCLEHKAELARIKTKARAIVLLWAEKWNRFTKETDVPCAFEYPPHGPCCGPSHLTCQIPGTIICKLHQRRIPADHTCKTTGTRLIYGDSDRVTCDIYIGPHHPSRTGFIIDNKQVVISVTEVEEPRAHARAVLESVGCDPAEVNKALRPAQPVSMMMPGPRIKYSSEKLREIGKQVKTGPTYSGHSYPKTEDPPVGMVKLNDLVDRQREARNKLTKFVREINKWELSKEDEEMIEEHTKERKSSCPEPLSIPPGFFMCPVHKRPVPMDHVCDLALLEKQNLESTEEEDDDDLPDLVETRPNEDSSSEADEKKSHKGKEEEDDVPEFIKNVPNCKVYIARSYHVDDSGKVELARPPASMTNPEGWNKIDKDPYKKHTKLKDPERRSPLTLSEMFRAATRKPTEEQRLLKLRHEAAQKMLSSNSNTKGVYNHFDGKLTELYARAKEIRIRMDNILDEMNEDKGKGKTSTMLSREYNELNLELERLVGQIMPSPIPRFNDKVIWEGARYKALQEAIELIDAVKPKDMPHFNKHLSLGLEFTMRINRAKEIAKGNKSLCDLVKKSVRGAGVRLMNSNLDADVKTKAFAEMFRIVSW